MDNSFLSGMVSGYMTTSGMGSSSSQSSHDIVRTNPYGDDSSTSTPMSDTSLSTSTQAVNQKTDNQKIGDAMSAMSKSILSTPQNNIQQPNIYNALFSTNSSAFQTSDYGGGRVSQTPTIQSQPIQQTSLQQPMQAPPIAPPPQPMSMPMMQPQAPQPMQLGAVSDQRAKTNIYSGNKDLENLLNRVYLNIIKGKV